MIEMFMRGQGSMPHTGGRPILPYLLVEIGPALHWQNELSQHLAALDFQRSVNS